MTAGQKVFTYSTPVIGLPDSVAPRLLNTSYTITADIDVPQGSGDGSIVAEGKRFGRYGLYLLRAGRSSPGTCSRSNGSAGKGHQALSPGKHTIVFDFKCDGLGFATAPSTTRAGSAVPSTGTLTVDSKVVSKRRR